MSILEKAQILSDIVKNIASAKEISKEDAWSEGIEEYKVIFEENRI